jgi:hypothetical protein
MACRATGGIPFNITHLLSKLVAPTIYRSDGYRAAARASVKAPYLKSNGSTTDHSEQEQRARNTEIFGLEHSVIAHRHGHYGKNGDNRDQKPPPNRAPGCFATPLEFVSNRYWCCHLRESNDEVERREVAPRSNEAALSQSSNLSFTRRRRRLGIARTDC